MALKSSTEEVINKLRDYLKLNVAGITEVLSEWPDANRKLVYPTITIFSNAPRFTNLTPYVFTQGDTPDVDNKIPVKWVVGYYDVSLQLDLWCTSKKQRHDMYEAFFQAFNKRINPMGLNLTLTDYHGVIAQYDQEGYQWVDDEVAAQRAEWRARIDVLAHWKAVLDSEEYAMINIKIDPEVQIPDTEIEP